MAMHSHPALRDPRGPARVTLISTPGWRIRLAGIVARSWRAFERQRWLARDIAHLEGMDDRLLRDIGIYRWEIADYVRGRRAAPGRTSTRR